MEDVVIQSESDEIRAVLDASYRGQTALVTGHNGFVGSWLSHWLLRCGANVVGLSLPTVAEGLADVTHLGDLVNTYEHDIREGAGVRRIVDEHQPKFVFHLAAQALVLPSYEDPLDTLTTNVIGTANVLEALRHQPSVEACVVVTSDKCYDNADRPHKEDDPLGGDDPYSASKAAAELIAHTYRISFLAEHGVGLGTARAGNIIGGGDWGAHRLVPDCMLAAASGKALELRHPHSVRPWQHVLDAVAGYLLLGAALVDNPEPFGRSWNFGPDAGSSASVSDLVRGMLSAWSDRDNRPSPPPLHRGFPTPHERAYLTLDSSRARHQLGWQPRLSLAETIEWTVDWYWAYLSGATTDFRAFTLAQIDRYVGFDKESLELTL